MNPRALVLASVLVSLAACSKSESGSAGSTSQSPGAAANAQAPAAAAKPAAESTKEVSLDPLPLKVKMPSSESAMTLDKSMLGKKSVGVSYDEVFAGFNVSEPMEKSFDEVKKTAKADKILFPFKAWVKEGPTSAVLEFNSEGKTGYKALAWREVGGKGYLCESAGLSGLKTPEDANKVLAVCETLAAK